MRCFLITILLIVPLLGTCQVLRAGKSIGQLWMTEMNVREVTIGKEIICNTQQVIWGNSADTLGFYFNDKELYFWDAKDKNLMPWIESHQSEEDFYALKQDKTGERYYVRRHTPKKDNGSYVIVVTNAVHGFPNYSFGYRFEVCSQPDK